MWHEQVTSVRFRRDFTRKDRSAFHAMKYEKCKYVTANAKISKRNIDRKYFFEISNIWYSLNCIARTTFTLYRFDRRNLHNKLAI